jgi:hypothetical protein
VALGLPRDQVSRERLLAVRAPDFLGAGLGGDFGHAAHGTYGK